MRGRSRNLPLHLSLPSRTRVGNLIQVNRRRLHRNQMSGRHIVPLKNRSRKNRRGNKPSHLFHHPYSRGMSGVRRRMTILGNLNSSRFLNLGFSRGMSRQMMRRKQPRKISRRKVQSLLLLRLNLNLNLNLNPHLHLHLPFHRRPIPPGKSGRNLVFRNGIFGY